MTLTHTIMVGFASFSVGFAVATFFWHRVVRIWRGLYKDELRDHTATIKHTEL